MRRRRLVLAAGALVVLGGGAAVVYARWVDPAPARAPGVAHAAGATVVRLVERGTECAGIGPLCLSRTLPAQAVLVRTASAGRVALEWRLSSDHLEAQTYAVDAAGWHLVGQRQEIRIAGIGRDERDVPSPTPLLLPAHLAVGTTWRATYDLRRLRAVTSARVVRAEDVVVGGRSEPTLVIEEDTRSTGPFHGDEHVTDWWSPRLGLPLRRTITRSLGGEFTYRLTLDLRVAALPT